MEKFIEYAEPIVELLILIVTNVLMYVIQHNKAKANRVAMEAVRKTEQVFSGLHDKSDEKRAFAISQICQKIPFISEKALNQLVDFALSEMQEYAAAEVGDALDEIEAGIMGGGYREEISH